MVNPNELLLNGFPHMMIEFELILRTGGNSWSTGPAPPPPPGQKEKKKEENGMSGMSGVAIAGIVIGVLLLLIIIIALFSKRRSSPSPHYFEDDKLSSPRHTSPLQSQEISIDMYTDTHKGFRGKFLAPCSILFTLFTCMLELRKAIS